MRFFLLFLLLAVKRGSGACVFRNASGELDCAGSGITGLEAISKLLVSHELELERLNLANNSLSGTLDTNSTLNGTCFRRLTWLSVRGNAVEAVGDLTNLPSLATLDLAYNYVRSVGADACANLTALHLDTNGLHYSHLSQLLRLPACYRQLRLLTLSENALGRLDVPLIGALEQLPALEELHFSASGIEKVEGEGVARHFLSLSGRLERLYLGGNPLECGCELAWYSQWAQQEPVKAGVVEVEENRTNYFCVRDGGGSRVDLVTSNITQVLACHEPQEPGQSEQGFTEEMALIVGLSVGLGMPALIIVITVVICLCKDGEINTMIR